MLDTLNILIRTSKRPIGFFRTIQELEKQVYGFDVHIIVSVDNDETKKYVKKCPIVDVIVECKSQERLHSDHNPYNEYFNKMIEYTKPGWVWRIDDDDYVMPGAINNIIKYVSDPNCLYIFNILSENNIIIPKNKKKLTYCDIATPNAIIHTKFNRNVMWKPVRGGDYRYFKDLLHSDCKIKVFYNESVIYKIDKQAYGELKDVINNPKIYTETMLQCYKDGKTWLIELPLNESYRAFCGELKAYLEGLNQRVVMIDTNCLKPLYSQFLQSVSSDFIISWDELNFSTELIELDLDGLFAFERLDSHLFLIHPEGYRKINEDMAFTAKRMHAFKKNKDRVGHIFFDADLAHEIGKLDIGTVMSVLPDEDTQQIQASTLIDRIISAFNLPVNFEQNYEVHKRYLQDLFDNGEPEVVDVAVCKFLNRFSNTEALIDLVKIFMSKEFNDNAVFTIITILQNNPENKEALLLLRRLETLGYLSEDSFAAVYDIQTQLNGE